MKSTARLALPVSLAILVALAGCGRLGGSPSPDDDGIAHPEGGALVFSVESSGGFVPPEMLFASFPSFALLGDGRVLVQGAVPAIFPGPALPAINARQLTEEGIQAVLRAIAESGQLAADAEWRGAQNFVADAADTVFTLHADGRDVTVSVYGLGALIGLPGEQPPNVPAAEAAAHAALSALHDRLLTIDSWMPAAGWADATWRPYQPESMRLLIRNADGDVPEPDLPQADLDWPVEGDPATFGEPWTLEGYRCGGVDGEAAQAWYDALAEANQATRFVAGDHRYAVAPKFLLPGDVLACPQPA